MGGFTSLIHLLNGNMLSLQGRRVGGGQEGQLHRGLRVLIIEDL